MKTVHIHTRPSPTRGIIFFIIGIFLFITGIALIADLLIKFFRFALGFFFAMIGIQIIFGSMGFRRR